MHGMTKAEVAEFKRIQAASRAMRTHDDVVAVKAMAAAWVRSARSATARVRRRMACNAIRGVNAQFKE